MLWLQSFFEELMMETCLNGKPDRTEPMSVEDLRKDLFEEFSSVSSTSVSSQDSLQEKEHLQVYLRIRPFRQSEIDKDESQECVETENSNSVILKAPRQSLTCRLSDKSLPQMAQRFHFSHVYGPETTQEEIFNGTVKSMVKDFLDGANSLVFTYGVSNAGKTFTFLGPENDIGILPRSLNMLFKSIDYKLYENMDLKPQRCREHIRLTKEQQSEEIANKNAILRLMKEVDSQNHLNSSNKFSSRSEGSSIDVLGDFEEQLDSSERFSLNVGTNIKFSLWVSFCEIYNENIFDLLDPVSNCALKRNTLRLAQDVKGNTFVKDLKWVQVSSPEEAYTILKLGKKHQTISCTKLNNLSSRSHSIFSIRILQIEDIGVPRVLKVSEFSLCDLAGSERCAKTQNKGDRLKEAGNINTSLMTLGKCINALRHNQQSKLQQHVPFRESKLTQYFKDFFCGRGKACMIVNINQCASMFDETLNVLKFSAVAQKVVVLNTTKPLPFIPKKSAREVSFLINNADRKKYWRSRKSSFVNWDMSLQDVPETSDGADEEESSEEENMEETIQNEEGSSEEENMEETIHNEGDGDDEITVDKESYEKMLAQITELQNKLVQEKTDKLIMESRIREEVSQEFMQLFEQRECDFSERLEKEREIIEKRGEERLHILKTLVAKQRGGPEIEPNHCESNEEVESILEGMMGSMQDDLADIKKQAEAAQTCLVTLPETQDIATLQTQLATVSEKLAETQKELWMKAKEIEALICNQIQAPNDHLKEAKKKIEAQNEKLQRLTEMCHEKDEVISNLQDVLDRWEESAVSSEKTVQTIKGEILNFKMKCTCMSENGAQMEKDQLIQTGSRKRVCDQQDPVGQPPLKKGPVKGECLCSTVTRQEHRIEGLTKDLSTKEAEVMELKEKVDTLEQQLASVREFLQTERNVKQGLCEQINKVKDELSSSKMNFSEVNDNIKQQASSYEILMSDLQAQRDANKMQTNKVEQFEKEIGLLRTEAVEKAEQIQMLQEKNEQLCNMEEVAKANAADLQSTKDLLVKTEQESQEKSSKMKALQNQLVVLGLELENTRTTAAKRDGSHFHATIEALRKECEQIVKVSSEKSQQIQDLEQQAESLKLQVTGQEEQLRQQLNELTVTCNELNEKEALVNQLKAKLEETILNFESERLDANEMKQRNSELEKDTISLKGTIKQLEGLLQTSKVHADEVAKMEEQLAEKDSLMACLQNSLKEAQVKLEDAVSQYSLQETKLQDGFQQSEVDIKLANEALAEQEAEQEKKLLKLKNEIAESAIKIKSLSLDLQRKDEDASDLREKLADAKKQIQQVQKEISSMRENEKSLRLKLNESDRVKNQVTRDLASRDRTILQLKNEMSNSTKTEEILQLYQAACKDLKAKEQIIEDMRLALTEQEETQEEQDKVLEAKIKELECLAAEIEDWKRKCFFHEKDNNQNLKTECRNTESENAREQANNLQESLKQSEEKHQADRRKWLDEKMLLIRQAKEAEGRRNQEMRKLMEDRERHVKLQTEVDSQTKQLSEKEDQLQKWRQERDELVAALEVQLKNLFASNLQKDQELKKLQVVASAQPHEVNKDELQLTLARKEAEIAELKEYVSNMKDSKDKHQAAVTASGDTSVENKLEAKSTEMANTKFVQQLQDEHSKLTSSIKTVCDGPTTKIAALPRSSSAITLHEEENEVVLNQSVLDSSEVSTENGRTSRFPKSELDIQFTPLRPNKMTVTRQGGDSSVTVKITRTAKKRKSNAMEKDPVEGENKKNTNSRVIASSQSIRIANNGKEVSPAAQTKRPSPLRKRTSYSSLRSVSKKDGALQKIGEFFQSSPTLLHSKAKKLIGSRSTAKSPETDVCKETEYKPRKSKRKLYKTEISSPLDIPSHPVVGLDQDEKESDHLIIKRRLRTRTAKR
ncbi:kinesin-like protein KIF20B isoform X1 [Acipenser ruthenus]|uniref:kinesin-like protein KIF20B isoform X1 n=3 Tax=Acipenser ruthenus TaxID=7906 RepID=UPI0027417BA3|nr:kinesin-like protein KIF20B isoform X1 [Acipenser ruthenus]